MAKFDFAAALALSEKSLNSKAIEAIILGPSGSGKSAVMGTFGCPTLYIYSTGESHGPASAATIAKLQDTGSTILPVCMDMDDKGNRIDGDAVLARIVEIMSDESIFDKYAIKAVAIDGASELETYVRASEAFKKQCLSASGKHNSYAEPAATCALIRPIFNRLKELQRTRNIHFAITAMLDVREYGQWNDVVEASPRAKGYQVAEMLIQQFGDVFVVGPMSRDGIKKWKFQFMSDVSKTSKDLQGNVKRAVNYSPRMRGVTPPPAYLDADFREVIKLKESDVGSKT